MTSGPCRPSFGRCLRRGASVLVARADGPQSPPLATFPTTVQFDRLCRQHGIHHVLAAPYSPTTCGKVERFHRSLRSELLRQRALDSLAAAQQAIDAYVCHYNTERPHQALGMLTPAQRFQYDEAARALPPPQVPPRVKLSQRVKATPPPPDARADDPFRITRIVAKQGIVSVAGGQYGVGRRFAGWTVTIVPDGDLLRFYLDNVLIRAHQRGAPATYIGGDFHKELIWRSSLPREAVSCRSCQM